MGIELSPEVTAMLKVGVELIPAIAQDASTGEVLMLAYMNHESLAITIDTGNATYWSRSRNELWEKGATSGHTQKVLSISVDCDGDALLLKVEQTGAACHTGDRSCFHNQLKLN
jgi:phosphoribosyl-AMP cyclohydrolase